MPDESIRCCVTSPPYYGLRDYGHEGQIGLEPTPELYVDKMVDVFREVRRVLKKDGTLWLNLGDSYNAYNGNRGRSSSISGATDEALPQLPKGAGLTVKALANKQLLGIPWRVAFALQADGWFLRQDIVWHKPNPMPESVTDRCTKAHEYVFLMSKSDRYFYDAEAVKEPCAEATAARRGRDDRREKTGWDTAYHGNPPRGLAGNGKAGRKGEQPKEYDGMRNKRSVWTVSLKPYKGAHFATFPAELIRPCIRAGTSHAGCCPKCGAQWKRIVERVPGTSNPCPKTAASHAHRGDHGEPGTVGKSGDRTDCHTKTLGWKASCACGLEAVPCTVLDPFGGSGTTGQVASEEGRNALLIELNPEYRALINERISKPRTLKKRERKAAARGQLALFDDMLIA